MKQAQKQTEPELARALMRLVVKGSLATLDRGTGAPYVSMVNIAADHDGSPLLLLSDLARHTANLGADARSSIRQIHRAIQRRAHALR
jgi:heme iron utilization protein